MEGEFSLTLETRVDQVEKDIQQIREELEEHSKLLMGDIRARQEGLFFVVADLGKLVSSHTELLTLMRKEFEERLLDHKKVGHYTRQSQNEWKRLMWSVADHVASALLIGFLIIVIGLLFSSVAKHCTGFICT